MNLTGAKTSPNIAEITVLDDRVRLALEIYIGDLDSFAELLRAIGAAKALDFNIDPGSAKRH